MASFSYGSYSGNRRQYTNSNRQHRRQNNKSSGAANSAGATKKKKKKVHWNSSVNKPFEPFPLESIVEKYISAIHAHGQAKAKELELNCTKIKTTILKAATAGLQTVNNNRLDEIDEISSAQNIITYLKKKQTYLTTHPQVRINALTLQKDHAGALNQIIEAFEKCYPSGTTNSTQTSGQKTNAGGESKNNLSSLINNLKVGGYFGGKRRIKRKTRRRKRKKTKKRKRRRRKHTRKR